MHREEETGTEGPICAVCRARFTPLPELRCRCGQPVDGEGACRICVAWPERFGPVESATWLTPLARRAVHALKYDGWHGAAAAMAAAMAASPVLRGAAALVPIPLGSARRRARGYNQSEAIAVRLSRRTGIPVRTEWLARQRETRTQTRLTPAERQANLAGAFVARGAMRGRVVVLVDDVFTTGSTLEAAAQALLAGGAAVVRGLTFARARRPLDTVAETWFHRSTSPGD